MPKKKNDISSTRTRAIRPGLTPESDEQICISLAIDLAKERLMNGTATSQEIVHFLKLASSKNRLEEEKIRLESEVLKAKAEALEASKRSCEMYEEAIKAFKGYSGQDDYEDEDLY